ncbi:hypothetical protein [Roseicitreum antarcticum]|uniref:Uncharacterized protein n=1 Tax=Roseicitreum antarcticum TaxID=564137 RepID=A0A1H2VX10_9RHOB|nr:hypothetical protein [Roseicitreum antarcticum]SDW72494.1 hypothetical protein SAMN04488238_103190 [Roseicitreum antarcticum]
MPKGQLRLFLIYAGIFMLALIAAWVTLSILLADIAGGQWLLLFLPPLCGMAVFHALFPLISRIRLGTDFLFVGGGLVYGLGTIMAAAVNFGLLDANVAVVFWLAGVFGPGWWLIAARAEAAGYFR